MSIEEKYELFDAYLENSLSAEEKISFDTQLLDSSFKKEFDEYSQIQNAFISIAKNKESENEFIQNLKSITQNYTATETTTTKDETLENYVKAQEAKRELKKPREKINIFTFSRNKTIMAAAAFLLIGFFVSKIFLNTPKQSMQSLYASNFKIEPLSLERGGSQDSIFQIATFFSTKSYDSTIAYLQKYLSTHPNDSKLDMVKAMCYLEKNNFDSTQNILTGIINQNNSFKEKAQWYLAMTFLKQGNKSKVLEMCNSFEKQHFYYTKAQAILKTIE
jgi:hypothetical protein